MDFVGASGYPVSTFTRINYPSLSDECASTDVYAELDQANSSTNKIQITIDDSSEQLIIDYDALFAEETHQRYVSFNDGNGVPIAHYVFTYEFQSSGDYSITFAPVNYERKTIYIQTKEADVKE